LYKSGSHHNIMSEDPVPLKIRRSLWNRIHPIITSYLLYVDPREPSYTSYRSRVTVFVRVNPEYRPNSQISSPRLGDWSAAIGPPG
jgi:hypothetical protein